MAARKLLPDQRGHRPKDVMEQKMQTTHHQEATHYRVGNVTKPPRPCQHSWAPSLSFRVVLIRLANCRRSSWPTLLFCPLCPRFCLPNKARSIEASISDVPNMRLAIRHLDRPSQSGELFGTGRSRNSCLQMNSPHRTHELALAGYSRKFMRLDAH